MTVADRRTKNKEEKEKGEGEWEGQEGSEMVRGRQEEEVVRHYCLWKVSTTGSVCLGDGSA